MSGNLKDALEGIMPSSKIEMLPRAFDLVGDIAILEIPKELRRYEKRIAEAVPMTQKNVKVVLRKEGGHEGRLRIQKFRHLFGERRTVTTHKENGVGLKLDIAKTYFSPRQASERQRVYSQIKKPEAVLVMFSGIAPFTIEIAKHTAARMVFGVELNRTAHKYALENAKSNKVEKKARLLCGDVRKIVPKLGKFDRIIMPLPKGAEGFLDVAFAASKKGSIIHFYDFEKEEDIPQKSVEKVKSAAASLKRKIKVLRVVKCGQLAPRAYRVCVDFKVN